MKTIEERANAYAIETIKANDAPIYDQQFAEFIAKTEKNAYIKGATEQREIDIRFAVESHCNNCRSKHLCHIGTDGEYHIEGIICNDRVLLEKAMKGE